MTLTKLPLVLTFLKALGIVVLVIGLVAMCSGDFEMDGANLNAKVWPGKNWSHAPLTAHSSPTSHPTLNQSRFDKMDEIASRIGTSSYLVVHEGMIAHEFGPMEKKYKMNSIRKSLLNALFGIYFGRGQVHLDDTLLALGLDDTPISLTPAEKQATFRDLLSSRSGVYIQPVSETPNMARLRPERGAHPPGTYFYYNNWSFNALGTLFSKISNREIFGAFDELIAQPLQMQDFKTTDGTYFPKPERFAIAW